MRLTISVNISTSFELGFEPTDHLDVDLATIAPEDRTNIAAIMDGTTIKHQLPTPTLDSLLAVAREAKARREATAAAIRQEEAEKAERIKMNEDKLREVLKKKPVTTQLIDNRGVCYLAISPDLLGVDTWFVKDTGLNDEIEAWRKECRVLNEQRFAAVAQEAEQIRQLAISARASMSIGEIVLTLPEAVRDKLSDMLRLVSDNGEELVFAGPTMNPKVTRYVTVDIRYATAEVTFGMADHEDKYSGVEYEIENGVLKLVGSTWAALVSDPSAPKPAYNFLDRCPGGYIAPTMIVGDVFVWGNKDRKGRKQGPYDRLVFAVSDTKIQALKVSYEQARKLRKQLT